MNNVVLIGRLTKDPESQNIGVEEKTSVSKFTLAVDREGNRDEADFIRVTTFGKQAETVEKYLSKGRQVAVLGRIQTGNYTDKAGNTVYTQDVIASRVEFLGSGGNSGSGNGTTTASVPQTAEDSIEAAADDIPF